MEKFMNLPEEKSYTAEDVVADYKVYGDKNLWQKDITCQLVKSQKF